MEKLLHVVLKRVNLNLQNVQVLDYCWSNIPMLGRITVCLPLEANYDKLIFPLFKKKDKLTTKKTFSIHPETIVYILVLLKYPPC
jgi:hypothetical protein